MRPWLVLAGALLVAVGIRGIVRARQRERVPSDGQRTVDAEHDEPGRARAPAGGRLAARRPDPRRPRARPAVARCIRGRHTRRPGTCRRTASTSPAYAAAQGESQPDAAARGRVPRRAAARKPRLPRASRGPACAASSRRTPTLGPRSFVLTRFLVSCCAADATPMNIAMIDADHVPKVGHWVEVTAQLDPHYVAPVGAATSAAPRRRCACTRSSRSTSRRSRTKACADAATDALSRSPGVRRRSSSSSASGLRRVLRAGGAPGGWPDSAELCERSTTSTLKSFRTTITEPSVEMKAAWPRAGGSGRRPIRRARPS